MNLTKECRMKVNVAPEPDLFLDRSYVELQFYSIRVILEHLLKVSG
jgi:hypothetical protein